MPSEKPITHNPHDISDMQDCLLFICRCVESVIPDDEVPALPEYPNLTPPQLVSATMLRFGYFMGRYRRLSMLYVKGVKDDSNGTKNKKTDGIGEKP